MEEVDKMEPIHCKVQDVDEYEVIHLRYIFSDVYEEQDIFEKADLEKADLEKADKKGKNNLDGDVDNVVANVLATIDLEVDQPSQNSLYLLGGGQVLILQSFDLTKF